MNKKLLIIGIDGGTWTILQPAIDEGYMPFLGELVAKGASGTLQSTLPAITPAAWGTFQTGVNPGHNGVHDFFQWDKKTRKAHIVNSKNLQTTLWDIATQAGLRHAVINLPMTYPPRPINGYMVTGILTPSLESEFTYPPEFKADLLKAVPDYQILNLELAEKGSPHKQFEAYVLQMAQMLKVRTQAAKFIMSREPLGLFMVQFQSPDALQHALWCYMDPDHPLYDADRRQYIFENFYRKLDEKIRDIHQSYEKHNPGTTTTFIVSDHGFQRHRNIVNLGYWLRQEGYLQLKSVDEKKPPLVKKITSALKVGKLLKLFMDTHKIQNMENSILNTDPSPYAWNRSSAYCRSGNCEGFIYLLEEDKTQREKTESRLTKALHRIKDPDNGMPVVKKVSRKKNIFSGHQTEIMPDLIIEPIDGYSFSSSAKLEDSLFHPITIEDAHVGKHHPNGIIVAAGDAIKKQTNLQAHLQDMTPTILYSLDLALPKHCDGQVLTSLFTKKHQVENHCRDKNTEGAVPSQSDPHTAYSQNDEKKILDRLKDLGYL